MKPPESPQARLKTIRNRHAQGYIELLTPGTSIQPAGYRRYLMREQTEDFKWLIDRVDQLEGENAALRDLTNHALPAAGSTPNGGTP